MSKFKTMIKKDIDFCNELIERNFANNTHVQTIKGKYVIDYPEFSKGFRNYAYVPGVVTNEIDNIKIAKGKLEYLLNRVDNPDLYNNQKTSSINISTVNNNENNNSNNLNINMTIDEIREKIEDNTYLGDKEKSELIEKLEEIVELQNSKESKSHKWDKAKSILGFLLDKGADIALMYIPHILAAIK